MQNKDEKLKKEVEKKFKKNQDRIFKKANSFFKNEILAKFPILKFNKTKNFDEIMKVRYFTLTFFEILEMKINSIIFELIKDTTELDLSFDLYLKTVKPYTDLIIQKIRREYK